MNGAWAQQKATVLNMKMVRRLMETDVVVRKRLPAGFAAAQEGPGFAGRNKEITAQAFCILRNGDASFKSWEEYRLSGEK